MISTVYTCECVECGHVIETDEHCYDLECPECGGAMRRLERPGPGHVTQGEVVPGLVIGLAVGGVLGLIICTMLRK